MLVDRKTKINQKKIGRKAEIKSKKQKVLKCVAFFTGGKDWFNVNRTAKNTLVLIKVLRI